MTKNALKKNPTKKNASHAPLDSVPLREDEDAARAMLSSVVLGRYRGATARRRQLGLDSGASPAELREFVDEPRRVPAAVRRAIVAACGVDEQAAIIAATEDLRPFEIEQDVRRKFDLAPAADWYVSLDWLFSRLGGDRDFLDVAIEFGLPGAINAHHGYAIPVSSLLRTEAEWAIEVTEAEPDMEAIFAAAVSERRLSGAPMVLSQTVPRRPATAGTPPGLSHRVRRREFEQNARWGVHTMNVATSVFGEGKPAENPSVRVVRDLRFTIIVDWQDFADWSIADAPELATVLHKRRLPIVGKAVFSDRRENDEVVEVLIVDADRAATEEIREAVSLIAARRLAAAAGTATSAKDQKAQSRAFYDRVVAEGVIPNAEAIARIWADGGTAVLFFEAGIRPEETGFGFTGPVGRMSERVREGLRRIGHVTARWCEDKPGVCRLFVVAHDGALLVNFTDGKYSIEPGSLGFGWSN